MKIVIDARIIATSTGRYVERLLHYLQDLDHDNHYTVLLLRKDYERWRPQAPNFHAAVADYPWFSLREQWQFAWQLYRLRADLVHYTMPQQPALYWRRHVTTIHDLTLINFRFKRRLGWFKRVYKNWIKPAVFRVVLYWFAHSSATIITPSQYTKSQVQARLKVAQRRIVVTPYAAELQLAKPQPLPNLAGASFLMYVGNTFPHKNIDRLIEAFVLLRAQRPELQLVIAGQRDYFYQQLERLVAQRQLEGVLLPGFISDAQLSWLYRHAAAYVFPSLSEGFGMPGLEAMVAGTPVVSSNATCLPEVYGPAAHYFNPENVTEMAARIAEVLDDAALRRRLIDTGHDRVQQYSWRRMAEQTLAVYRQVLVRK